MQTMTRELTLDLHTKGPNQHSFRGHAYGDPEFSAFDLNDRATWDLPRVTIPQKVWESLGSPEAISVTIVSH